MIKFFLFIFSCMGVLFAKIQVIPFESIKPPSSGSLTIYHPGEGQVFEKQPILIEVELENFPLGVRTANPTANHLFHSDDGQSLHVIIDNEFTFYYRGLSHSLLGTGADEKMTYRFNIPHKLEEGEHILRIFPATSYGESIKDASFFKTTFFYVKKEKPMQEVQLNQPFLTYNEPFGTYKLEKEQPLLLDFFVSNCQLSKDGCKVILRIDDAYQKKLIHPPPYLIFGLEKRKHKIELLLVGPDENILPGKYNQVMHMVKIE